MRICILAIACLILVAVGPGTGVAQAAESRLDKDARCPVCGMFVAKFPNWLTRLKLSDGRTETFDGVKDLMAYSFAPQMYGAAAGSSVQEVMVKDYYNQNWIDGRQALYVLGSDVYGPMGHELIPFADRSGAESFLKDHKGQEILDFAAITPQLIESLRQGHGMMGHGRQQKQ